jgi:hypothetical protein
MRFSYLPKWIHGNRHKDFSQFHNHMFRMYILTINLATTQPNYDSCFHLLFRYKVDEVNSVLLRIYLTKRLVGLISKIGIGLRTISTKGFGCITILDLHLVSLELMKYLEPLLVLVDFLLQPTTHRYGFVKLHKTSCTSKYWTIPRVHQGSTSYGLPIRIRFKN